MVSCIGAKYEGRLTSSIWKLKVKPVENKGGNLRAVNQHHHCYL